MIPYNEIQINSAVSNKCKEVLELIKILKVNKKKKKISKFKLSTVKKLEYLLDYYS